MARPRQGYSTADGRPVPGVTTILGLLGKPALVGWAGKTCTAAAWQLGRDGAPLPKWGDILYPSRDDAAAAGTLVHELFEAHLRHQPLPPIPDSAIGAAARQGYDNAVHWLETSSLGVEPYEKPLVSEMCRFGGTPDALMIHGDAFYLGDWKTGGLYAEHVIQMAAYRQLLSEVEGVEVQGCHLVRFNREHGDFHHAYFALEALDQGWEVFRRLLEIKPLLDALEKRVK